MLVDWSCTFLQHVVVHTVETRSTDTHLIPSPVYNGQFHLSRRNAHIFSLKLTRLRLVICALFMTEYLTCENLKERLKVAI